MLKFFMKRPKLGIEVSSSTVRLAAVAGGDGAVLRTESIEVPSGLIRDDYGAPSVLDPAAFTSLLKERLSAFPFITPGQPVALSLSDGLFRVQILEFDALPRKRADRERLVRWRLEKTAAVDTADSVLRFQVIKRQEKGHTLLACLAKRPVITQYEQIMVDLGLEPWTVGQSAFHAANWYAPAIGGEAMTALAYVGADSLSVMVFESGRPAFYRYKEMKKAPGDLRSRLTREIDDSLHFYSHMDRSLARVSEVQKLFLAGDSPLLDDAAAALVTDTLPVSVLAPAEMLPKPSGGTPDIPASMAAALGAGGLL
jgi:hypothetical protein